VIEVVVDCVYSVSYLYEPLCHVYLNLIMSCLDHLCLL
jgi:hypothetical protein